MTGRKLLYNVKENKIKQINKDNSEYNNIQTIKLYMVQNSN